MPRDLRCAYCDHSLPEDNTWQDPMHHHPACPTADSKNSAQLWHQGRDDAREGKPQAFRNETYLLGYNKGLRDAA